MLPPAKMSFRQWKRIRQQHEVATLITHQHPSYKVRLLRLLSGAELVKTNGRSATPTAGTPHLVPETQAALITFSSGSTGHPKAIYRSHAVLIQQHRAILQCFLKKANPLDFPLFPNILLHNMATGTSTLMPDIPDFRLEPATSRTGDGSNPARGGAYPYRQRLLLYPTAGVCHCTKYQSTPGRRGRNRRRPVPERLLKQLQGLFSSARVYVTTVRQRLSLLP